MLYSARGGLQVKLNGGYLTVSWPLAAIEIYKDRINLKIDCESGWMKLALPLYLMSKFLGWNRTYSYNIDDISYVQVKSVLFGDSMTLVSKVRDSKPPIKFGSASKSTTEQIVSHLKTLGIEIQS